MPKIALIDMDGTIFDYNKAMRRDLMKISSPEEIQKFELETRENFHDLQGYMEERTGLIRNQHGWWENLELYGPGQAIYNMLKDIGFCCKILTKGPRRFLNAWTEKARAIQKHFGDDMPIDIVGKDKGGTYGRVLVDDYPKYIQKWVEHRPRGLVIMPAWEYNAHYKHENVIRYNNNHDKVWCALEAAYTRKSKQHWRELME